MIEHWVRFVVTGAEGADRSPRHGLLRDGRVHCCLGDPFAGAACAPEGLPLAAVRLLAPGVPGRMIGLWNNFQARAAHEGWTRPEHPLYFVKTPNCYLDPGATIRQPASYDGPVVFEAELAIVIGRQCANLALSEVDAHVFGYTCINDVTARGILKADPSFPQWARAKSFDTFGPFGPVIARGVEPDDLRVIARLDGATVQDYPVADMFHRPREIVAALSRDMTLLPGDLIACGTSLGAGPMKSGQTVEVEIPGIGCLINRYE